MPGYRYYDTPDGEDWLKKQYYLLKYASVVSGSYMPWDVFCLTRPLGVVPVCDRMIRTYARPLIFASLWGTGTFISTKLRGKDDGLNHVVGTFCAFKYWSHLYPRPFQVWALCCSASLALFCFKDAKVRYNAEYAMEFYDVRENLDNGLLADFMHWSWIKEKPRQWLTVEEAKEKGLLTN